MPTHHYLICPPTLSSTSHLPHTRLIIIISKRPSLAAASTAADGVSYASPLQALGAEIAALYANGNNNDNNNGHNGHNSNKSAPVPNEDCSAASSSSSSANGPVMPAFAAAELSAAYHRVTDAVLEYQARGSESNRPHHPMHDQHSFFSLLVHFIHKTWVFDTFFRLAPDLSSNDLRVTCLHLACLGESNSMFFVFCF